MPSGHVKNLGVVVDSALTMNQHVRLLCRTAYMHLYNIGKIRKFLSRSTAEKLVHALISSRLDYGNSLLYGISNFLMDRIQSVQKAAARVVTRTKKRDHITPVLKELHWLPVSMRIEYKLLMFTYKALHGLSPPYMRELLNIYNI